VASTLQVLAISACVSPNPNTAPTALEFLKRAGTSTVARVLVHVCRMLLLRQTFQKEMARTASLSSMPVEPLLKLRDDIGTVLSQKANQLQDQLSRLGGEVGSRSRRSPMKGRKVAIKYRDKSGNSWAGRGAQPVWLRERLKAGAKLEDFAIQKTASARKAIPRKSKKRRKTKR
jgi:DNA-binding protein H-NS